MEKEHWELREREVRQMSAQALAYVGDAVMELCVRSYLLERGLAHSRDLNREAMAFVTAPRQAEAAGLILPHLSDREMGVYRRAHNVGHLQNVPRSATAGEYRTATGLEALFGYLYLLGDLPRVRELFLLGYPCAADAVLPLLTEAIGISRAADKVPENGAET